MGAVVVLAGLFFVCSCKQCEKVAIIRHMNTEVANKLFELQMWAEILKKCNKRYYRDMKGNSFLRNNSGRRILNVKGK